MDMVTLDLAPTRRRPALITNEALAAISARCESAPATEIVAWAVDHFGSDLVVATSFQDAVLIDVVTSVAPDVEFAFIDTGFHFPETLAYVETLRDRYDLRLSVISAGLDPGDSPCGSATCCRLRKVEPLIDFLADRSALDVRPAPGRGAEPGAAAPIVAWDAEKGSVKVNPLANWSDRERDPLWTGARPARASAAPGGLPLDRLRPDHGSGPDRRGPTVGPLGRHRQDRVRPAHLIGPPAVGRRRPERVHGGH